MPGINFEWLILIELRRIKYHFLSLHLCFKSQEQKFKRLMRKLI